MLSSRLPLLLLLFLLGAQTREGCIPSPLEALLPRLHFVNMEAVRILLSASQQAHVCFGLEGASELQRRTSLDQAGRTYRELLQQIAPELTVHVTDHVVNLGRRTRPEEDWLETPLLVQTEHPEDLHWIADWLLGNQLYYRARPGLRSGMVGNTGDAGVKIGPYPKQFRSARHWLDQIVQDGGGGCWLTPVRWLKREGPPPIRAWTVLLYSTSPDRNQQTLMSTRVK